MRLSAKEQELVQIIENMRQDMDTEYRKQAIRLAQFGRDAYNSVSRERIGNIDILNIPFSYAIINHRLATLWANPSRATVRAVDPNKKNNIELYNQVNEYDKNISRYISTYQELERTANVEGTCFFGVDWNEIVDRKGRTVGIPSTMTSRIRLNDFWWDKAARTPKEMNHGLRRMVMSREQFLRMFLPLDGKDGYKNISKVPFYGKESTDFVYNEEWEQDMSGNYVTVWHFESRAFLDEKKGTITKRKILIANGIPIFSSDELTIPPVNNVDLLPWSKIDGIPTGYMIGMSIPVLVRHPQEAFSRLLTLSTAQAEINASPPILLRAGASNDFEDYPLFAGSIIPVKGSGKSIGEDYQVLQLPDISNGAQKIMNDLMEYMIMIAGVDIKALFVPASEKAITTQNKREIQEKLLKFSVLHNEENGFYDMELMRLALIQNEYPKKRTFLERNFGKEKERKGYMEVGIQDHEVEKTKKRGKELIKLNFKKGAYTRLEITPEHIQFNVDLYIEGASTATERDSVAKRNFIENLNLILSIPAFAEKINQNPDKALKYILKQAEIPEEDFLEVKSELESNMHPAQQELLAINLEKPLRLNGFNVPEDIPAPDKYMPSEFVDAFSEYRRSGAYGQLTLASQKIFDAREREHKDNAMNPYFHKLQAMEDEKESAQEMMPQQQGGQPQMQQPAEEGDLMQRTRQEAAQIGAATRA